MINKDGSQCNVGNLLFSIADSGVLVSRKVGLHGKYRANCTLCGQAVSNLQRHMRTHTGEKPYACALCRHRFTQTSSLYLHMRRVHNEGVNF